MSAIAVGDPERPECAGDAAPGVAHGQEQTDKLQGLLKAEISAESLDNTDLFRPPAEWTQIVSDHQQSVVRGAAEFLSPGQLETLKGLDALDLAQRQAQRAQQCKALGIKNGAQNQPRKNAEKSRLSHRGQTIRLDHNG